MGFACRFGYHNWSEKVGPSEKGGVWRCDCGKLLHDGEMFDELEEIRTY